jgi:hypothetical protein
LHPHASYHPFAAISIGQPGIVLLAGRTDHDLLLPINAEPRFIKPFPCFGLPTGIGSEGTHERDPIVSLAANLPLSIGVASIDEMDFGSQILLR